ncbi:hypothetical protein JCM14036_15350 [Desulfotomaculum defluvii]
MSKVLLIKKATLHPLSLLDRLTRDFIQEDYILTQEVNNLDILLNRMTTLSQQGGIYRPVFTIYPGGDCSFINTMKENSAFMNSDKTHSADHILTFLLENILEPLLGLKQEEQNDNVSLMKDIPTALKSVDEGEYALGFIF